MTIEKASLQNLRPVIDRALELIGKQYGVEMRLGNGSYDSMLGTFSFKLIGKDAAEGAEAPEMIALKRYADMYGIDMGYLDRDLLSGGHRYRMCGLRVGRTNKVIAKREDGKCFVFDIKAFWSDKRKEQERENRIAFGAATR